MSQEEVTGSKLKPLLGNDNATIDSKGRILISKKKRDRLGDNFAMCMGKNGCLCAYPEARWEEILRRIDDADPLSEAREIFSRLVLPTADDELSFDEQGRVVVPQQLRNDAGLKKDVIILGCGDRLEIWDVEEYKQWKKYPDSYKYEEREQYNKAYREMQL